MPAKNKKVILLSRVENIMQSDLDLKEILNNIMEVVGKSLKSEKASLLLLNEETGELTIEASYGLSEDIVRNVRQKVGDGSISGWVAQSGEPLMLTSQVKDRRFKGVNPNLRSALIAPLKVGSEVIGVINVSNLAAKGAVTEDDLDTLTAIAKQSASLVKTLRLQRLLLTRTEKLELVHQTAGKVNSVLNTRQLMELVTKTSVDLLSAQGSCFFLKKGEELVSTEGFPPQVLSDRKKEIFQTVAGEVMKMGKSLLLSKELMDGPENRRLHQLLRDTDIGFLLGSPVKFQEKLLGVFVVFRPETAARFTWEEITFFETICELTGIALSNALLYENLLDEHQKLVKAQQMLVLQERIVTLAQLAGSIAHELRNPLTAIFGMAELAEKGIEESGSALAHIKAQAMRASRIIEGLQRLSRQKKPEMKPVEINHILENSVALLNHKLMQNGVEVEKAIAGKPVVTADETQLQQIFMNLINNAVEAMTEDRKKLRVESAVDENRVVVKISDTGSGIPAHVLTEIWQPFFTTKSEGTGLGLAIVKDLVEANSGTIQVETRAGEGTTFTLTFQTERNSG